MNLQAETVETLNATSFGRLIRKAVRPAVHFVRRVVHPDVPPHLQRSELTCYGKRIRVLHRRTFAIQLPSHSPTRHAANDKPNATNKPLPVKGGFQRGLV